MFCKYCSNEIVNDSSYCSYCGKSVVFPKKRNEILVEEKNHLFPLQKKGKWGYCDINKKVIIPFIYDYAENFNEGLAKVGIVMRNSNLNESVKYGFIDIHGNQIIQLEYDEVTTFKESFATIMKGKIFEGKWGLIDKKGTIVLMLKYEEIGDFHDWTIKVRLILVRVLLIHRERK